MVKYMMILIALVSSVGCRHADVVSGQSNVKALSTSETNALTFLKDRGLIVNPNTLAIEEFTAGTKPDTLKDLEIGDVLSQIRVLVRKEMLEPLDESVASLAEVGGVLDYRAKQKELATTLRFTRPTTKKLYGVTVASDL